MKRLTPYEETVIRSFIEYFSSFSMIGSIVLYGSRSKGISNEYSDVDIAVVVDKVSHVKDIEKKIEEWNISKSPEILIHFLVINEDGLHKTEIGREILKGDILWSKQHRVQTTSST